MNCNEILTHVMNCDDCKKLVNQYFAQRAGSSISKAKSEASRLNGLKGGRPKLNRKE